LSVIENHQGAKNTGGRCRLRTKGVYGMPSNPFLFGKAVSGSSFVNRKKEIKDIGSSLERGQSIIIFSPRRYGKTSLIKQVITTLSDQGILVFYLDLYRVTTLEQFGRYYSQTVISSLRSGADKLFSLVRTLIPSLKPKLTYTEPNMPAIELEVSLETMQRQLTLSELFNFLEKYCLKKKQRACVVFDEFQEITSFDSNGILEREMRAAFQHHQLVSYAFLGSKAHLMNELFKDKARPFYNFGSHFELGPITEANWAPFISSHFKKTGLPVSEDLCRRIVELTHGHPYYTQMLCSEIWELSVHTAKKSSDPVASGLVSILQKENHAFAEIWDTLTSIEKKLLSVLAGTDAVAVFSTEFLAIHQLGATSSMQRVILRLLNRGIITRNTKGVSIADPLFCHWIRREDGA
jgi:hypothetical protein